MNFSFVFNLFYHILERGVEKCVIFAMEKRKG
nr:MAG TPA: hypothetical protein [Bacteriophage sp.]